MSAAERPAAPARKKSEGEALLDDVTAALINLGYNKNESQRAAEGRDGSETTASLLRVAEPIESRRRDRPPSAGAAEPIDGRKG